MTASAAPTVAVVGYACLDSSTSVRAFHGIDATSILERPLVSSAPAPGGIAHLTRAVAAGGAHPDAVSWVGDDHGGRAWTEAVGRTGGTAGIVTAGTRSPSATLIEVGTGGTICLFDPGDCQGTALDAAQSRAIEESGWTLLTVAPRTVTEAVLSALPPAARLVWAVKHDEDAYDGAMVERLLARADVVSFSRGERPYLSRGGTPVERLVRPGALVVETRGADGVGWARADGTSTPRQHPIAVDPLDVDDTTGAGDTFVGTLTALLASSAPVASLEDTTIDELVTRASRAATALLRERTTSSATTADAPQKENH